MIDAISLGAEAYAGWHSAWLDAHGVPWAADDNAWRALAPPPFIYLAGIALRERADPAPLADAPGPVLDAWSDMDLSPFGWWVQLVEPWFVRDPVDLADDTPSELDISEVTGPRQMPEFEDVSVRGFGGESASLPVAPM